LLHARSVCVYPGRFEEDLTLFEPMAPISQTLRAQ
jgi:hypothetical protein